MRSKRKPNNAEQLETYSTGLIAEHGNDHYSS